MRKHFEVLRDWVPELAVKLDRPEEEIRAKGLSAFDFGTNQNVHIDFGEGSFAEFRLAFFCIRPEERRVAIFTEHCGYHEFPLFEDMEIVELTLTSHYRHGSEN